jgi:hypothetical protein
MTGELKLDAGIVPAVWTLIDGGGMLLGFVGFGCVMVVWSGPRKTWWHGSMVTLTCICILPYLALSRSLPSALWCVHLSFFFSVKHPARQPIAVVSSPKHLGHRQMQLTQT